MVVFNASFSGSRSYGVIWTFMGLSVLLRKFIIAFSASSKGQVWVTIASTFTSPSAIERIALGHDSGASHDDLISLSIVWKLSAGTRITSP
ncbi:hypothetical protein ES703_112167 [subsurface metagenome]